MSSGPQPEGGVVVDTTVFGARLSPARAALANQYSPLLLGRDAYVSFVTVAELRFGARLAGWGDSRLRRLENHLALQLCGPARGWSTAMPICAIGA